MQVVLFLLCLILYLHNLSPSVYGGDVGDLVTAAYLFGVPHPPGYPLFTFLGFLLSRLAPPFNQTPATMVGVISAVASAAGVVVFFTFAKQLTKNTLIAIISSLTLAFSFLFWFYAEIAEVFALNNFFAILLLTLAYFYRQRPKRLLLFALSFIGGLSLTNHHTILFVFPAVLSFAWTPFWKEVKSSKKTVLWCFLLGLAGFSVYIYAVVASLTRPLIDWAYITDIQSFIDLVLRKKYGTFQLAAFHTVSPAARFVTLKTYFILLVTQLTIPVVILSLLGFIALLKREKIVALALLLTFILTGPFFVVYAGFYLNNSFYFGIYERFLSLSSVIVLFFLPMGLLAFTTTLARFFSRKEYLYLFQGIFLLIPIMLFIYNFPKTNLSHVWIGDELGINHIAPLPKGSILYLSGDTNLFNTWYVRYARGIRPDTQVLNGLSPEKTVEIYGEKYGKSERSDFADVLIKLDEEGSIFSDFRFPEEKLKGTWVPFGLYYEYRSPGEKKLSYEEYRRQTERVWKAIKLPTKKQKEQVAYNNHTIAVVPEMYANGLVVAGNYFLSEYQQKQDALTYYHKALEVDPQYSKAYATIGAFYLTDEKNCQAAIPFLEKALELYQFDRKFYLLLFLAYRDCGVTDNRLQEVASQFSQFFSVSLIDAIKDYEEEEQGETQ